MANTSSFFDELPEEMMGAGPDSSTLPWTRKRIDFSTIEGMSPEDREYAKKGLDDFLQKYKGPEADSSTARINLIRLNQFGSPQFQMQKEQEGANRVSEMGRKSHAASVSAIKDDLGMPFDGSGYTSVTDQPFSNDDRASIRASQKAPISVLGEVPEAVEAMAAPQGPDRQQELNSAVDPFKAWLMTKSIAPAVEGMGSAENVSAPTEMAPPSPQMHGGAMASMGDAGQQRFSPMTNAPAMAPMPTQEPAAPMRKVAMSSPEMLEAAKTTPPAPLSVSAPSAIDNTSASSRQEGWPDEQPAFVDDSMNAHKTDLDAMHGDSVETLKDRLLRKGKVQEIGAKLASGKMSTDEAFSALADLASFSGSDLMNQLKATQEMNQNFDLNSPNSKANQQVRPEDVLAQQMFQDTKNLFLQGAKLGQQNAGPNPFVQGQNDFRNWVLQRNQANRMNRQDERNEAKDAEELAIKRSLANTKARNANTYARLGEVDKAQLANAAQNLVKTEAEGRALGQNLDEELTKAADNFSKKTPDKSRAVSMAATWANKRFIDAKQAVLNERAAIDATAALGHFPTSEELTDFVSKNKDKYTVPPDFQDPRVVEWADLASKGQDSFSNAAKSKKEKMDAYSVWNVVGKKMKLRDTGNKNINEDNRKKASEYTLAANEAYDAGRDLVKALSDYGNAVREGKGTGAAKSLLDASIKAFGEKMSIANQQGVVTDGEISTLNRIYSPFGIQIGSVNDIVSAVEKVKNLAEIKFGNASSIDDMKKAASEMVSRVKRNALNKVQNTNWMEPRYPDGKIKMRKGKEVREFNEDSAPAMRQAGWTEEE